MTTTLSMRADLRDVGQKFYIFRNIGRGAFGEIFVGKNSITNEDVAIKIVSPILFNKGKSSLQTSTITL